MGYHEDPAVPGQVRRPPGVVLAVIVALVVGVGAGYLWRTVTEPVPVEPPAALAPAPAPASPPRAPVPSSCAAVAQRGEALLDQLEGAVAAIGALDPTALRAVVNESRRLRDELQRDVDACRNGVTGAPAIESPPPR
jgi:hypothetical protein